jgi:molybdopterin-containing oxidoreductase family iron-sulfur binding subunit
MKRRDFLSYISSSLALLSASCQRPEHKIVPAVNPSEFSKPGNPVYFNSAFQLKNCAYGITIKTVDGKPVKIDGNSDHKATFGVVNPLIQGSLYSLYNPERFFQPEINRSRKTIEESTKIIFDKVLQDISSGKQVVVFINENCSPSFQNLIQKIKEKNKSVHFVRYSPFKSIISSVNRKLFDIDAEFMPDFDKADFVLTVEADILGTHKLSPIFAKKLTDKKNSGNPLISIESNLTLTGIYSDRRYSVPSDELLDFILNIYLHFSDKKNLLEEEHLKSNNRKKYDSYAKDIADSLIKFGEKSVIVPGDNIPDEIAEIIMLINYELGNIGINKIYDPISLIPFSQSYTDEEREILSGKYIAQNNCTIIFLETNPFYSCQQNLKNSLTKIQPENFITLSLYPDETYQRAGLKLPASHYLEKWGDLVFYDGNYSIIQPVIKPLNKESISSEEFLLKLYQSFDDNIENFDTYYDYIREFYKEKIKNWNDWDVALRQGYFTGEKISNSQNKIKLNRDTSNYTFIGVNNSKSDIYLKIIPSYTFYDDYEPNNPYLLELPEPISKITWENAGHISTALATKYDIIDGDIVRLISGYSQIEIPVFILNGIADRTIVISSGFGRKIKNSDVIYGVNPFILNYISENETVLTLIPIKLEKTNKKIKFAMSQTQFKANDNLVDKTLVRKNSIYPGYEYKGQKWGMLIDLSRCIGCNSCVISCQFENNIPIVGKNEVQKGRIMHWIKIDRYEGKDFGDIYFEPMLCQQCENAPCESVCPVGATSHNAEGINEMTYNRCIGARFCMVNCPYNVRKFNYENYYENVRSPLENMLNPEITVRMRGIAEKCTFCVQRINHQRIDSKNKGLKYIPDGNIKTACQEACPSEAIIFGDLNYKTSKISKLMKEKDIFHKLEFLNTKPSVAYVRKERKETKNA